MPKHDFLGIPNSFINLSKVFFDFYDNKLKDIETYTIDDSIILYLNPITFSWIKSNWNDEVESDRLGLSYYGFSLINSENIILLKEIFLNFLLLFKYAPNSVYVEDGTIEISKQTIIKTINEFNEFIDYCLENNLLILHCGI